MPFWAHGHALGGLLARAGHGSTGVGVGLIGLVALAVSVVLAKTREAALVPSLLTAWAVTALLALLFASGLWFPWYLAWCWPVLLARWTRPHAVLIAIVLSLSLLLTLAYVWKPS